MNKDQIKGSIREVAGKIQKGVGNAREDLKTKRELDREDDEEV